MSKRIWPRCIIFGVLLGNTGIAGAECIAPDWANSDEVMREGTIVTVTCVGTGATLDLSTMDARDRCEVLAARESRTKVLAKSIVIESNRDVAIHNETATEICLVGMSCSNPKTQSCEAQGVTHTWRRCSYDMSKVHEGTVDECVIKSTGSRSPSSSDPVSNRFDLGAISRKVNTGGAGKYERGGNYILRISTVPPCDDIVFTGPRPRIVTCKTNPLSVSISSDDSEIIVRSQGYIPKKIQLNQSGGRDDHIDIYLDLAD